MSKNDPESPSGTSDRRSKGNPLVLAGLAAVGFVALFIVIIYLTHRLETVEDQPAASMLTFD